MSTHRRERVWIVEDSPLEAEMARRALADAYDVETIADGPALLERIATDAPPEALVLDWYLPGMSGLEICRFVRAERDEMTLPILIVTAFGRKEDLIEGLQAGANDYLTKPYDVAELRARVGTLVRTARLHQAQRWRSQQLEVGARLGEILTKARRIADVAPACCQVIVDRLGIEAVALYRPAQPAPVLLGRAGADAALDAAAAQPSRGEGRDLEAPGGRVVAVRPLRVEGQHVATLVASTPRTNARAQLEALDSFVDTLALAFARARAEEERQYFLEGERTARSEAEAANRAKDEFLAMVSHELRTPLNAIAGWTRILVTANGAVDPGRMRRALETIDRNVTAQTQLIDDLLDVNRIISGKLRVKAESVDLAMVVSAAAEAVRLAADSKGVRLVIDLGTQATTVQGDPDRLQQVAWNLLSNAIKFTPRGGTVTVSLRAVGASAEVSVEDSGQGIDPAFLPYIFDRFRQADSTSSRRKAGLGLGLAIVRHLVELHGGTIQAESEGAGRGATFVARFPRTADEAAREPTSPPPPEAAEAEDLAGVRALIVDDERDSRDLLAFILREAKVSVQTAATANQAFELLREQRPDVLISDVGLPEEDGISFIRRVRALSADEGGETPAIALTAYARPTDRALALGAGFSRYLRKPVNPSEVVAAIAELVRPGATGNAASGVG